MPKKIAGLLLIASVSCATWNCCGAAEDKSIVENSVSDADAAAFMKRFAANDRKDASAFGSRLRPTAADYEAVFEPEFAKKLCRVYEPAWDAGQFAVAPKPEETAVKVFSATSDEMKNRTGAANEFSAGWRHVAPRLKPNVRIYGFKFVRPGSDLGTVYEGLIYVNGNWRFFPKPWRALD